LTDENLKLIGIDWDKAKEILKKESSRCGEKEEKLSKVESWNRKSEDIKMYINEIAKLIDDKNVHWTMRLGTCLGKEKPSGQLADFLGDEFVNGLW
jgi:hypothetical protein